jgi:hypothetical protein
MTTRCSIDSDPGRNPPPNPNGRPSLGASASAGHGNPVAHTHTDSWHTASTIDDQPYTVRGAPAARQRRRAMNRRLERRLDLVPQKCAKSVCLSSISRITHVSDTGRPEGDSPFSSPRWTVAALVGVRLAVAGRLCRLMGSLRLTGRVHAAAVADRRAAARFDVHADRTNRCGDFWLGGCTRRSHRVARLVVRRRFTACWPR